MKPASSSSSSSSSESSADSSSKGSVPMTFRPAPHSSQLMVSPSSTSSSSTSIFPSHTGHSTIDEFLPLNTYSYTPDDRLCNHPKIDPPSEFIAPPASPSAGGLAPEQFLSSGCTEKAERDASIHL